MITGLLAPSHSVSCALEVLYSLYLAPLPSVPTRILTYLTSLSSPTTVHADEDQYMALIMHICVPLVSYNFTIPIQRYTPYYQSFQKARFAT
jgi:hypothetical protein